MKCNVTPHSWGMVRQISYSGYCFWIVLYTALQSERGVTIFLISITDCQGGVLVFPEKAVFLWIQFCYSWEFSRYCEDTSCPVVGLLWCPLYLNIWTVFAYWTIGFFGACFPFHLSSFLIPAIFSPLRCWERLKF